MTTELLPAGDGLPAGLRLVERSSPSIDGLMAARHGVQFYEDDEYLCDVVARYVGAGLAAGEAVVLIATERHWESIARRLSALTFDVARATGTGRLRYVEARATLSKLLIGGVPDGDRFRTVIGGLMAAHGRVRAYGEMVDLLWRDGNLAAALQLEELWNQIARERSISLLCAYLATPFDRELRARELEDICRVHDAHALPRPGRTDLEDDLEGRLRNVGLLEQRARALEDEVGRRKQLEGALREALEAREHLEESLRFLSEASGVLAGSLDYEETLQAVTGLSVPRIADWVSIDIVGPDGVLRRVAAAHVDPPKAKLALELSQRHPPAPNDPMGPASVIRTGHTELLEEVSDEVRARAGKDPEGLRILDTLGLVSSMCVPLHVAGQPVGAITLVSGESGRRFGASDVALAEELVRRASMAIDNARVYREAQNANRVRDDFLATMSHELRTPLNAILGWSAMLRAKPEVNLKKAVDTIERNARAQVRLIEEILDVSRIMTGKLKLERRSIDLAAVLRASVDVIRPSAVAKEITLEALVEAEPCPFYGDAARLQQVFLNLLSNAVKFTPTGGRVEARLSLSGADVELAVEDTGRGIPRDFIPVMFQRFRQADSSTTRTHGGLGVGLAIVGHLVGLHGGVVKAHSAGEGRGATFTVRLPVPVPSAHDGDSGAPTAAGNKLLSGLRILVCEDDADCRELLEEVLSSEGATVRLAAAAAEALSHFQQFRPDVLVSDIGLPLVDGYALIRQIRELGDQEGGHTPAIALTAYAGSEDARRALSAGYQLHVTKPVDPDELTSRVATLAGRPRRTGEGGHKS
ncbi:MAG TPA: ATP-binding protein [Polyangiaceae bacterium]|jgi:signal transduction histidine kinase/ActR/RegA family two-component response regulator